MAEKKTIAFYCSSLTKGGAERVFANLAEYFTEKGYTVYMVTQYQQEDEYCLKPGIPRILSDITPGEEKNGRIGNFFARFFKLRNIFKKIKPDIVFSCNGKNNFMAECAGMGLHCKTVVSVVADPKMEYPTGQMRLLAKVLFRFADGIVFQTKEAMDFFPKAVRKKGVILPNSLNPQFIRERFEGEREKKIVAVGRLDDNKNHAMLLEAFAEIKEDFPDYRVVIYGEGEDRSKLEKLVATIHMASVYALLSEFPSAHAVASAHLTRLTNLLSESSHGRYGKDTAVMFREAARNSIGSNMPAKSLELKHTIKLIQELTSEIDEIETEIKSIMDEVNSPILSIPGINYRMGAMILAEIGDFSRFDSPDKILAYAGMSPSTYQSGQLDNCYSHMEKRGSRYLRYALYNATKYVCHWDESFGTYLAKKRAEGKHYNVALSHATKKLVRTIYAMEKTGQSYSSAS